MSAPSTAILRLDYSLSYGQFNLEMNRRGFVGLKVFPSIAVDHQTAQFLKIELASLLRPIQDTTREERGEYKPVDFEWTKDSYATEDHGLRHDLDDRNLKSYKDMINQELIATQVILDGVCMAYEQECATLAQNTSVYADAAASVAWSTHATATPIDDILTGITAIENATGQTPNSITIPNLALRHLRRCAQVIDQVKYDGLHNGAVPQAAIIGILKDMTGLKEVNIANGFKNTGGEGGTATLTRMWDSAKVFIHHSSDGMGSLSSPQLRVGNTVQWAEEAAAQQAGDNELALYFESYRSENVRGETLRGRTDYALKRMHDECGYIITGCVA